MNQQLSSQDIICINLILANVKVLSELVHNVKGLHGQALKQKFSLLFNTVKGYEAMLEKATSYDAEGKEQLELIYDRLMEVNYALLEVSKSKAA